jgi:hypothetical protein
MQPGKTVRAGHCFMATRFPRVLFKVAAIAAIAAVAWVFVAPRVDLLDSTCGVGDGALAIQLPEMSVPLLSNNSLVELLHSHLEQVPAASRSGSELREVTCSHLC